MEGASKMNKQEAIEKIEKGKSNFNAWEDLVRNRAFEDALTIVKKIDDPEKPVVPQFVADWYEEHKDDIEYNLYNLCTDFREQKLRVDLHVWFGDDNNKPIETLVKMKLFGYEVEYEVEKKKLYTVEIPNPDYPDKGKFVLCKNKSGKVFIKWTCLDDWEFWEEFQLTEEEVKEKFNWAWQFAKEVKECNQEH